MFDRNDDHKLSRDEFEHMGDRIFYPARPEYGLALFPESDFTTEPSTSHDASESQSGSRGRRGGGMGGSSNGGF